MPLFFMFLWFYFMLISMLRLRKRGLCRKMELKMSARLHQTVQRVPLLPPCLPFCLSLCPSHWGSRWSQNVHQSPWTPTDKRIRTYAVWCYGRSHYYHKIPVLFFLLSLYTDPTGTKKWHREKLRYMIFPVTCYCSCFTCLLGCPSRKWL